MNLTIFSRPVKPRATRTALIVASVPELTMRTISTDGHGLADEARQLDLELGGRAEAGALVRPARAGGRRRPGDPSRGSWGPRSETKSTNSLPSASQMWAPLARAMNSGCGMPTPFIARTGELTPPGMYCCASSKRRADVVGVHPGPPANENAWQAWTILRAAARHVHRYTNCAAIREARPRRQEDAGGRRSGRAGSAPGPRR